MKQLIVLSAKKKQKPASLLCKLFYLTCVCDRAWYGMEDDFSIFHIDNFLPFRFHSILQIFHFIFHSILKFSSSFHSISPYQRNFRLEAMQRILCCFASLRCCKQGWKYRLAINNRYFILCFSAIDYCRQRWSPRGRPWPRGHILKSLALASKVKSLALTSRPLVLENWPVLGSRTAVFFELLKFRGALKNFFGKLFLWRSLEKLL